MQPSSIASGLTLASRAVELAACYRVQGAARAVAAEPAAAAATVAAVGYRVQGAAAATVAATRCMAGVGAPPLYPVPLSSSGPRAHQSRGHRCHACLHPCRDTVHGTGCRATSRAGGLRADHLIVTGGHASIPRARGDVDGRPRDVHADTRPPRERSARASSPRRVSK